MIQTTGGAVGSSRHQSVYFEVTTGCVACFVCLINLVLNNKLRDFWPHYRKYALVIDKGILHSTEFSGQWNFSVWYYHGGDVHSPLFQTHQVDPNVNHELWSAVMCPCRFITAVLLPPLLVRDVDTWEAHVERDMDGQERGGKSLFLLFNFLWPLKLLQNCSKRWSIINKNRNPVLLNKHECLLCARLWDNLGGGGN